MNIEILCFLVNLSPSIGSPDILLYMCIFCFILYGFELILLFYSFVFFYFYCKKLLRIIEINTWTISFILDDLIFFLLLSVFAPILSNYLYWLRRKWIKQLVDIVDRVKFI